MRTFNVKAPLVVGLAAIAVAAPSAAFARPPDQVGVSAKTARSATAPPRGITFTNPLGRSRGPGAGMGLL